MPPDAYAAFERAAAAARWRDAAAACIAMLHDAMMLRRAHEIRYFRRLMLFSAAAAR